jgi:squalene-hopene/tetraprenyl-beta-curcumene cyclase
MQRITLSGALLALACLCTPALAQDSRPVKKDGEDPSYTVYSRALGYLLKSQHPNGGFGQIPGQPPGEIGITGLVIKGMAGAPEEFQAKAKPALEKAMAFVLKHQQKDGSFTQQRSGLSTYRTAIAINAMVAVDRKRYAEQIKRAADWLKGDQFDAEEGVAEDSPHFGGFGYDKGGKKPDADMSNTLMAIAALRDAGISPDDPVFKRALTFLSRCQNSSETNPGVGKLKPKDDGGFIYDPGLSRNKSGMVKNPDGTTSFESYASMTYGGLMSMIYVGVSKDDARIKAALAWIKANYTLEENYGLGIRNKDPKAAQQGLYYYYHVFAKALGTLGSKTVETKSGKRFWAQDLLGAFAKRQQKDGSFVNPNDRWWEQDPTLVTAYVINSLNYAWDYIPRK